MKNILIVLGFILIHFSNSNAQVFSVSTQANAPYTPYINTYITQIPTPVTGQITRLSAINQQEEQVKLVGVLKCLSPQSFTIKLRDNYRPASPIIIAAGQIVTPITAAMIQNSFSNLNGADIEMEGISQDELVDGLNIKLPEGIYSICINVLDYNNNILLSDPLINNCANFSICYLATAPELQSPINYLVENTQLPAQRFLNYVWSPAVGTGVCPLDVSKIRYDFTISEILPGQTAEDAINILNPNSRVINNISTNSILLDTTNIGFIFRLGMQYAVMVQAHTVARSNFIKFENGGASHIGAFTWQAPAANASAANCANAIEAYYPATNDWIPFDSIPFIIHWCPYNNSYDRFSSIFNITDLSEAGNNDNYNRNLNWQPNPQAAQQMAVGNAVQINETRATYNGVYKTNCAVPGQIRFKRGHAYQWRSNVTLHNTNGADLVGGTGNHIFHYGMSKSLPNNPQNNAVLNVGNVSFEWQTANAPAMLVPESDKFVFQASQLEGNACRSVGHVYEKWIWELARNRRFSNDSIIAVTSGIINPVGSMVNAARPGNLNNYLNEIYKDLRFVKNFTAQDTGAYYWRIKWLTHPQSVSDTTAYQYSDIRKFTIMAAAPVAPVPAPRATVSADCIQSVPLIVNPNVANYENSDVRIGAFTMRIISAQVFNNNHYSGTGLITWTLANNAKIRVQFSDIQINNQAEVFSGEVYAAVDANTFITPSIAYAANIAESFGAISAGDAQNINNVLQSGTRLFSQLSGSVTIGMPLGFDAVLNNNRYTIAIVGLKFTPRNASLNALFNLEIPEAHGWLSLGGRDFCFSNNSFNFDEGTLYLPRDRDIAIADGTTFKFKGAFQNEGRIDTSQGTYVSWDRNGFKNCRVHGQIDFPRTMIVPDNADGSIGNGLVQLDFAVSFQSWSDWMVQANITNFQLVSLPGFGFVINNLVIDHSARLNPVGIQFPASYIGANNNTFQGVYLQNIGVRCPPTIHSFGSATRKTFIAYNNIINRDGYTGNILATQLINMNSADTGSIGGWAFGIDTLQLEIVQNNFRSGRMGGNILLPISTTPLAYNCNLRSRNDSLQYNFTIHPTGNFQVPLWSAQLTLQETTFITIQNNNGETQVLAHLDGAITINNNQPGAVPINLPQLGFRNFELSNYNSNTRLYEFFVQQGTWSLSSPPKTLGGFTINIDSVKMVQRGNRIGLGFLYFINIGGASQDRNVMAAKGNMRIMGIVNFLESHAPSASFDRVYVDSIVLNGAVGPVRLNGRLDFYADDATYGNGVKGNIQGVFPMGISVGVTAQFGHVATYDYWYVDAMATFGRAGLPLPFVPGVKVTALGGGVYYNMLQSALPSVENIQNAMGENRVASANVHNPSQSSSGMVLTPQEGNIGVRLMLGLALANANSFNCKATLGAAFIAGSGLRSVSLVGTGYIMTNYPENTNSLVTANVNFNLDIPTHTFDGHIIVEVNVPPTTRVRAPIDLFFSPTRWYVYVGNPSALNTRVTAQILNINTAPLSANLSANAYFCTGNYLPNMPPVPQIIVDFLGARMPVRRPIDASQPATAGFMFGASVQGGFSAHVLVLYARAEAIAGFDMELLHRNGFRCDGTEMGHEAGIAGWYATGQLYGYFNGAIGLDVNMFDMHAKVELCALTAGAVLQGGLPNPTWAEGAFRVQASTLEGLIHIDQDFALQLGNRCIPPIANPISGISLITGVLPNQNARNVSLMAIPEASFNMPINQNITINITNPNPAAAAISRTYRFNLVRCQLFKIVNNVEVSTVACNQQWPIVDEHRHLLLQREEWLQGNTQYRFKITLTAKQWYDADGWQDPMDDSRGARFAYTVDTIVNFTTGQGPSTLPNDVVDYCYPISLQKYFLKSEGNQTAYLKLNQWPGESIFPINIQQVGLINYQYIMKFTPVNPYNSQGVVAANMNRDRANRTLWCTLPVLDNSVVYKLDFIRIAAGPQFNITDVNRGLVIGNSSSLAINSRQSDQDPNIQINSTQLQGGSQFEDNAYKIIYSYYFKTSQYNTLLEKINGMNAFNGQRMGGTPEYWEGTIRIASTAAAEPFEVFDIDGYTGPSGISYAGLIKPYFDFPNYNIGNNHDQQMMNMYNKYFELNSSGLVAVLPNNNVIRSNSYYSNRSPIPIKAIQFNNLCRKANPINLVDCQPELAGFIAAQNGANVGGHGFPIIVGQPAFGTVIGLDVNQDYYTFGDFGTMRHLAASVQNQSHNLWQLFGPNWPNFLPALVDAGWIRNTILSYNGVTSYWYQYRSLGNLNNQFGPFFTGFSNNWNLYIPLERGSKSFYFRVHEPNGSINPVRTVLFNYNY
jgi:hypothetical protein